MGPSFSTAQCILRRCWAPSLRMRFSAKYKTIVTLSLVYCAGHLVGVGETRLGLAFGGLTLIAIGAGGIKPCVSAHVGSIRQIQRAFVHQDFWLVLFFHQPWRVSVQIMTPVLLTASHFRRAGRVDATGHHCVLDGAAGSAYPGRKMDGGRPSPRVKIIVWTTSTCLWRCSGRSLTNPAPSVFQPTAWTATGWARMASSTPSTRS